MVLSIISALLGDLPENAAMTLTFNSINCNYPCHNCLIEGDNLNNVKLNDDQIIVRTPENMKEAINKDLAHQFSIHGMKNIFWKHL